MFILAHDGVGFPVTEFKTVINNIRAFRDDAFASQDSSRVFTTVAFPSTFWDDSQVFIDGTTVPTVFTDPAVDSLNTDMIGRSLPKVMDNLFRAPLLLNEM